MVLGEVIAVNNAVNSCTQIAANDRKMIATRLDFVEFSKCSWIHNPKVGSSNLLLATKAAH